MTELIYWINSQAFWQARSTTAWLNTSYLKHGETDASNKWASIKTDHLSDCSYSWKDGSPTQAAPSNWQTVGGNKNMAWLRASLKISEKLGGGNPNITYIVKGRKIKCWVSGQWVLQFSSNPAWIVRDFLTNKRYGLGRWISEEDLDDDTFREVADYCDELVTYTDSYGNTITEPRYSLNMIVAEKKSATDHLSDMFANFGGFLTFTNDVISLKIEKAAPKVYDFTDDTIIADSVSITQTPLDDTPNQYRISYIDPLQNWTPITVLVEDTVDQDPEFGRGKIISKDVRLNGCTSQGQALRLGRLFRDLNATCSIVMSFGVATHGMHLEPGDVVSVSWNTVFAEALFRILEIAEDAQGVYSIKARQYNESIYHDSLGAQIQIPNYTQLTNPMSGRVPHVTNVGTQETFRDIGNGIQINELEITWAPGDLYYHHAEVYIMSDNPNLTEIDVPWSQLDGSWGSIVDTGVWKAVGTLTGYERVTATNLAKGYTYSIKVVAVNSVGRKADFDSAPVVSHLIHGKTYAPAQPSGLGLNVTSVCTWTWNQNPETDIDFYELREDLNVGDTIGLLASVPWNTRKAIATPMVGRTGTVYLFAHNIGGNYSAPCTLVFSQPPLAAPTNVTIIDIIQGMTISCDALPVSAMGINVHIDDGAGEKTFFSPNNYYEFKSTGGGFVVRVAYVDQFGEGAQSEASIHIVKPFIDPALIEAQSITITALDAATQAAIADGAEAQVQVSTVVASLNNSDPSQTGYSAITQLHDGIQLKVDKAGVIAAINATPEGIAIEGKLVHITGQTIFDDNVVVAGALAANAVTADAIAANAVSGEKISGGTIDVSKNIILAAPGGGITLDNTGLKAIEASGAFTKFDLNGITWFSSNGVPHGAVRRVVSGSCPNGKFIRLNWEKNPFILLSPSSVMTNMQGYSGSGMQVLCQAYDISPAGFRVQVQTVLTGGTGVTNINYQFPYDWPANQNPDYIATTLTNCTGYSVTCTFNGGGDYHMRLFHRIKGTTSWTQTYDGYLGATYAEGQVTTHTFGYTGGLPSGQYEVLIREVLPLPSYGRIYLNSISLIGGGVIDSSGSVNFIAMETDGNCYYTIED